jgi:hypothetical protein
MHDTIREDGRVDPDELIESGNRKAQVERSTPDKSAGKPPRSIKAVALKQ